MMIRIKQVTGISLFMLAAGTSAAAGTGVQAEPDWALPVHDDKVFGQILVDRLEYQRDGNDEIALWDAQAWLGKDRKRLWIETEGKTDLSTESGEIENFDVQYSYRLDAFWDIQTGLGAQSTFGADPNRERYSAIIGLQGLAPYWFEVDTNLRVTDDGDVSYDLEAEYDWLLTQRLILQGRGETLVAFSDVEEWGVGTGINNIGLGLRLRYQFSREFAPYIGVSYTRYLGNTKDLRERGGEGVDASSFVAGVRWWF
ncbi:MAG: copper resistance protein B [Marinobacter sp.]